MFNTYSKSLTEFFLGKIAVFSRVFPALFFAPASSIRRSKSVSEWTRDFHSHIPAHMVPTNIWLFSRGRRRDGNLKQQQLMIAALQMTLF